MGIWCCESLFNWSSWVDGRWFVTLDRWHRRCRELGWNWGAISCRVDVFKWWWSPTWVVPGLRFLAPEYDRLCRSDGCFNCDTLRCTPESQNVASWNLFLVSILGCSGFEACYKLGHSLGVMTLLEDFEAFVLPDWIPAVEFLGLRWNHDAEGER